MMIIDVPALELPAKSLPREEESAEEEPGDQRQLLTCGQSTTRQVGRHLLL